MEHLLPQFTPYVREVGEARGARLAPHCFRGARNFAIIKLMKRNLTIQLDEGTIRDAKIIAARKSMSLSRLVSEEIGKAAAKESSYEKAKRSALSRLKHGYDLGGGKMPDREELYER